VETVDACQFRRPRVTLKSGTQVAQFFRLIFAHMLEQFDQQWSNSEW